MSKKKHDRPEELLAGLLANYKKPEGLIGEERSAEALDQTGRGAGTGS